MNPLDNDQVDGASIKNRTLRQTDTHERPHSLIRVVLVLVVLLLVLLVVVGAVVVLITVWLVWGLIAVWRWSAIGVLGRGVLSRRGVVGGLVGCRVAGWLHRSVGSLSVNTDIHVTATQTQQRHMCSAVVLVRTAVHVFV